ncbi:iron ABC transporter permease [Paenibacillus antri]|uniref:Iron ABC transporter permease n=1 Tax=Paenibacillus antri TaxID=2582848 RepID=A0A5R9G8F2_9BACL|nr:iron ABC transporter permease [Paenibacillus antri]TLS51349.1 iron ABC transporter permease [Paenibacillus antri]
MKKPFGLLACVVLLCGFGFLSIAYGSRSIDLYTVWQAFAAFDGTSADHLIVRNTRLPRTLVAAAVGAALAVSGAIMQTVTRNPLASPSIFGVNSGAALCIIVAISVLSIDSQSQFIWAAFLGAALAAGAAYGLGSVGRGGGSPVNITLAGAAVTAFASSITQGIMLVNGRSFDQIIFWLVGSVAGREMPMLLPVLPFLAIGAIVCFALAAPLNTLALGEDVARGLGQRVGAVKLGAAAAVVLLAGSSVAVAGPIAFVGIVVPHIARFVAGRDHRWLLPYSALLGSVLLLGADVIARFVAMPNELPVGVVTALIGVPFFVWVARRDVHAK